ncbi:penicillin-binding transpeptidase domain-containing protein, partial [Priestia megaterium]|uniref:penicillin-binding transpeptidase domain-containing protein n=1 Tax=Priestia megaterium TaxID=1404 RepID=UPI00339A93D1
LSTNPDKPLMNRFTKTYSPGSTFKLVTGALAVDEGVVNPNESISISGKKWQKDEYFQSLLDDMDDLLKDMRQREKDSDHLVSEHMKTVNDIFDNAIKNLKKDRN